MAVRKFRNLQDAERSLWLEPGDPQIWEGLLRRWALHRLLRRPSAESPPGISKFRSIAEKQEARRGRESSSR